MIMNATVRSIAYAFALALPLQASLVSCDWMSSSQRARIDAAMQKYADEVIGEPMVGRSIKLGGGGVGSVGDMEA